jgi:hypothetical protein
MDVLDISEIKAEYNLYIEGKPGQKQKETSKDYNQLSLTEAIKRMKQEESDDEEEEVRIEPGLVLEVKEAD